MMTNNLTSVAATNTAGNMKILSKSAIYDAIFRSVEGYVSLVVDSIEFELGRELNEEECQHVYHFVEGAINRVDPNASKSTA